MKVQLVVVRGKPEGKVIPLTGSSFKIGRGETCHLRPNSEQVSREHAEFIIESGAVIVRDLGSRNGTLVNGKALVAEPYTLKDRDLVQVGPLTFAVSILDAPVSKPAPAAAAPKATPKSPDDVSNDDIDSWLLGDNAAQVAEQPTAVYGGDTITIAAFRDAQQPAAPANKPPSVADDSEYERQTEDEESEEAAELEESEEQEEEEEQEEQDEQEDEQEDEEDAEDESAAEEEFMDPNNPFYAAKKAQKQQSQPKTGGAAGGGAGAANATFKDSSDAANEILRKLMERRKASKS